MPDLLLYHFESCRYCARIRDFLEKNDLDIPMVDVIENQEAYKELLKKTDRYTVPCLMIDGKPLYESEDIILWMRDNLIQK